MAYPILPRRQLTRKRLEAFRGYDRNYRIPEGAFSHMKNLTSDCYPLLAVRPPRGIYATGQPQGLIAKDSLCYVDGSAFVLNGRRVELGLRAGEKQLVSMGAYVIILPDKCWINTLDETQFGPIEADFTSRADVSFTLCNAAGVAYGTPASGPEPPEAPQNGQLWLDTSGEAGSLKSYSQATGLWSDIPAAYIKLHTPGIGAAFSRQDGVTISGILEPGVERINGSAILWDKGEDWILVSGVLDRTVTQTLAQGPIRVRRQMPDMDFVVEAGNRLWGCRYGLSAHGEAVNQLYASKLGDFKNWECFMGISTDSWQASLGSDGPFTGAISHLGHPLFFKEDMLHKVYISQTGAHSVQDTLCRGVMRGCGKSLTAVGETVYYKSPGGVVAYDGSLPHEIGKALGYTAYSGAVAGSIRGKYYLSVTDDGGQSHLFVYDTEKDLWHREDGFAAQAFCPCRGELYAIEKGTGRIWGMLGTGQPQGPVAWEANTGDLSAAPDRQYVSRLQLRLWLAAGSRVCVSARYDEDPDWEQLCHIASGGSCCLPLPVRRCSRLQLRLEGVGDCRVYSLTRIFERGSDRP